MENDHVEDALLFIDGALESLRCGYPSIEHQLTRAREELLLELKKRDTPSRCKWPDCNCDHPSGPTVGYPCRHMMEET